MCRVLAPFKEVRQSLDRGLGSRTLVVVCSVALLGLGLRLCSASRAVEFSGSGRFDREGACL